MSFFDFMSAVGEVMCDFVGISHTDSACDSSSSFATDDSSVDLASSMDTSDSTSNPTWHNSFGTASDYSAPASSSSDWGCGSSSSDFGSGSCGSNSWD